MAESSKIDFNQLKLESQIIDTIYKDNKNTVHFYYEEDGGNRCDLSLFTYNKTHGQPFLLNKTNGVSKQVALSKMFEYVIEHKEKSNNSYTVIWEYVSKNEIHESYFSAKDIGDVMEKFYYGKENKDDAIVFEVKLNPIS